MEQMVSFSLTYRTFLSDLSRIFNHEASRAVSIQVSPIDSYLRWTVRNFNDARSREVAAYSSRFRQKWRKRQNVGRWCVAFEDSRAKRLPVCIAGVTIWLWRDKVLIKVSLKYLRFECFVFPSSPMAGESRSSQIYAASLHFPFTGCANIMRPAGYVFMLCISWNFNLSIDHTTNW